MKQTIRMNMMEKLALLTREEKKSIEKSLLEQFIKSNLWIEPTTIGITISHGFEWETRNIIQNQDRKSTRLNSSHVSISYAVFCLKKKIYMYSYKVIAVIINADNDW